MVVNVGAATTAAVSGDDVGSAGGGCQCWCSYYCNSQ